MSLFMKTNFLTVLLSLLISVTAFPQGKTEVLRIRAGGKEFDPSQWNNINISTEDSISFFFAVRKPDGGTRMFEHVVYKYMLTGGAGSPVVNSETSGVTSFGRLSAGEYIFKVQAVVGGKVELPAQILRFSVGHGPEVQEKPDPVGLDINLSASNILTAICAVQLIIIIILLYRRKALKGRETGAEVVGGSGRDAESELKELKKMYLSLKKEYNRLKERREKEAGGANVIDSYESLKKDYTKLMETNAYLKKRIDELKNNITDLQEANDDLLRQKQKLLEKKRHLEELQAQKDELFAMAIHDIKNPAAAIKSYVELLDSYDLNAQEQQEIMQSLADTSSRIIDLAQKMSLVVAKTNTDSLLSIESGSVKTIIDSVCKRNLAYATGKKISLINQASPHIPDTKMDSGQIEEALENLVNNAIKYSPQGSVVQVRAYFSDTKVTVEVTDNGVGIPEKECRKAFEKGILLSPAPTGGEPRSGLGLWIVKRIVEEHDGRVWLKSKEGAGSTFGIELPIRK